VTARAWSLFAIVSVLWGIPYLFIAIAVDGGVPPAFLAWARVVLGALVLLPIAWRAGVLPSLRGRWRWLAPYAIAEIVIPFPLIAAGERHVSSSIAAILIAATPLIVALLAIRFDASERVSGARLVGLFIGLAGVVALVGVDVAGEREEMLGALAILVAAFGYAAGPMMLSAKLGDLDPRASMLGALTIAGLVLTPLAAADLPGSDVTGDAIASVVVLGVVCTAAAFVAFGALVRLIGAGRSLVITYVNPLVAVVAGMIVLDERPGPGALLGLLLILAGSYLATGGRPPGRRLRPRTAG
jgi:drug/metabolite transporter (DMT)-like permease